MTTKEEPFTMIHLLLRMVQIWKPQLFFFSPPIAHPPGYGSGLKTEKSHHVLLQRV